MAEWLVLVPTSFPSYAGYPVLETRGRGAVAERPPEQRCTCRLAPAVVRCQGLGARQAGARASGRGLAESVCGPSWQGSAGTGGEMAHRCDVTCTLQLITVSPGLAPADRLPPELHHDNGVGTSLKDLFGDVLALYTGTRDPRQQRASLHSWTWR